MYIWDVGSWQLLHEYEVGSPNGAFTFGPIDNIPEGVQTINWSLDGGYVVVGTASYETSVWDMHIAQLVYRKGDASGGGPGRVWLGDDGWMGDGANKLNAFTGERLLPSIEDNQHAFGGSAEGGTTEPRPDNTQIAWGNDSGFLLIIDLNTTRGVQSFEVADAPSTVPRRGLADISWNGTWDFIAAASRDGELYVTNLVTGDVTSVLTINGQLNAIDWNPQSNEIIYAGVSDSGEPILSVIDVSGIGGVPADPIVLDVAWSPDGTRIAYGGSEGPCEPEGSTRTNDIDILDVASNTVVQTLTGTRCPITSIHWSPDGSKILASTVDIFGVKIWDVNTGEVVATSDRGSQGTFEAKWRPDGQLVAVAPNGNITVFMNPETGEMNDYPIFAGGNSVDWNPAGTQLVIAGYTNTSNFVHIVDVNSEAVTEIFHGESIIGAVNWNGDGSRIAYGDHNGMVQVWNVYDSQVEITFTHHHDGVTGIAWHPDGRRLVTASRDNTVHIYDIETGHVLDVIHANGYIRDVAWSPDGTQLAYGDGSTPVIVAVSERKHCHLRHCYHADATGQPGITRP